MKYENETWQCRVHKHPHHQNSNECQIRSTGHESEKHKIWTWRQHSKVSQQTEGLRNWGTVSKLHRSYQRPLWELGMPCRVCSYLHATHQHRRHQIFCWECRATLRKGERGGGQENISLEFSDVQQQIWKIQHILLLFIRNTNLRSGKFCSFLKILNFFIHDPFIILKHLYPTKQCHSTPALHQEICTLKYLYKKKKKICTHRIDLRKFCINHHTKFADKFFNFLEARLHVVI